MVAVVFARMLVRVAYNVSQLVVSAGLKERNYQLKNKLQWKTKI
jgi:hypothetical protein